MILIAALIVWAIIALKIDVFTEALKRDEPITFLITIDDGNEPILTEVLIFNPHSLNGALIALPKETGMLLSAIDKVGRLELIYDPDDITPYAQAVSELLNRPIDFSIRFHLNDFEHFVDYLGGLNLFTPKAVDAVVDGKRYLFPPGGVKLDGAKARSYVEYLPSDEHIDERTDREHRIIQSLLRGIGENVHQLLHDSVFPFILPLIHVDFDQQGLKSFFRTISEIYTDRLVFQGILGNKRILEDTTILFPYYDGKLIKETVKRITDTLTRDDNFGEDLLTVRVEIQNGTTVNGLASRTAQVFESYGFRAVSVTNADRDNYERTIVLDRRGNPEAAQRVAELIRCELIYSRVEENRDETVDVTLILGKDFRGRYVE